MVHLAPRPYIPHHLRTDRRPPHLMDLLAARPASCRRAHGCGFVSAKDGCGASRRSRGWLGQAWARAAKERGEEHPGAKRTRGDVEAGQRSRGGWWRNRERKNGRGTRRAIGGSRQYGDGTGCILFWEKFSIAQAASIGTTVFLIVTYMSNCQGLMTDTKAEKEENMKRSAVHGIGAPESYRCN